MTDRLLRTRDLCAIFHVGPRKVRELEAAGMPCICLGKRRYYHLPAVRAWLAQQRAPESLAARIEASVDRMLREPRRNSPSLQRCGVALGRKAVPSTQEARNP